MGYVVPPGQRDISLRLKTSLESASIDFCLHFIAPLYLKGRVGNAALSEHIAPLPSRNNTELPLVRKKGQMDPG